MTLRKFHCILLILKLFSGERPFQCLRCYKRFSDNSSYVKHKRTHTNTRLYKCPLCSTDFTQTGDRDKHLRTHNVDAKYLRKNNIDMNHMDVFNIKETFHDKEVLQVEIVNVSTVDSRTLKSGT